jgi:ElaB/YqjD/DUF883 family membrane-anchored ribosome-binding protein
MPNSSGTSEGYMADQLAGAKDDLSERAGYVKDKVSDVARTATDKINEGRSTAADGLDTAASRLRDKATSLSGGEELSELAHSAAEGLSTTADYVRKNDVNRMMSDVEALVKNNPGPSLAVAAVFGFLVGRAMSHE